jgi:two-component system nitrate/nitrite response regulator NarL
LARTTVYLVDPRQLVREGLKRLLEAADYAVIGEAPSLTLNAVLASAPSLDLIVFEVDERQAGDYPGLVERIRRKRPRSRLVVLTADASPASLMKAVTWGVDGYLSKDMSAAALATSLKLIALGQQVFPPHATMFVTRPPAAAPQASLDPDTAGLSARELEILGALVHGRSNKAIARELSISATTVKVHLKALLRKIRQTNLTQAAVWAMSHGIGGTQPTAAPSEAVIEPAAGALPALVGPRAGNGRLAPPGTRKFSPPTLLTS